jgi:hypothetical protein
MDDMYDRMFERLYELPDTPRSMLVLLDEFPNATVQDWFFVFCLMGSHFPLPEHWDEKKALANDD